MRISVGVYVCMHVSTSEAFSGTAHLLQLLVGVLQADVVQVSVLGGLGWSRLKGGNPRGCQAAADTKPYCNPRAI